MNLEYMSGFFDADGSITMSRDHKTAKYKTIKVDFSNNEHNILLSIQEFLRNGYGINSYISTKAPRASTHSVSYTLSTNSNQQSLALCSLINSIHPKKTHRINTVLKYHNAVTRRNGKYTHKEHIRRLAYERLFFCPNFH